MLYKVNEKYGNSTESHIAVFKSERHARIFIQAARKEDTLSANKATYVLYEGMDKVEEFPPLTAAQAQASQQSSTGTGQRSGSLPTPLPTSLRPTGMPPSSRGNDDEKK